MRNAQAASSKSRAAKIKEMILVLAAISIVSKRMMRKLRLLAQRMPDEEGDDHG